MNITVKKPTQAERADMLIKPTWGCGVSEFDWHYDSEETCLLTEGEVTVTHDGGSVSFGAGDYVVFPKGLSCVWKVSKPVKKHYLFKQLLNMELYNNPNCKKVRGSHVLEVTCAYCKCSIANYQKVGKSGFVKMYNDRVISGSIDFSRYHGAIFCPKCGERIATRYITKIDKKEAYRFVPSAFNSKKVKL